MSRQLHFRAAGQPDAERKQKEAGLHLTGRDEGETVSSLQLNTDEIHRDSRGVQCGAANAAMRSAHSQTRAPALAAVGHSEQPWHPTVVPALPSRLVLSNGLEATARRRSGMQKWRRHADGAVRERGVCAWRVTCACSPYNRLRRSAEASPRACSVRDAAQPAYGGPQGRAHQDSRPPEALRRALLVLPTRRVALDQSFDHCQHLLVVTGGGAGRAKSRTGGTARCGARAGLVLRFARRAGLPRKAGWSAGFTSPCEPKKNEKNKAAHMARWHRIDPETSVTSHTATLHTRGGVCDPAAVLRFEHGSQHGEGLCGVLPSEHG